MAKLSTASRTIETEGDATHTIATALDRKRRVDPSYEIYLSLYQAITGPEERQKLFREFSPGFFDLIVIDECHRGSAAEDSAWREILEYFSSATQIGLTATPKETKAPTAVSLALSIGTITMPSGRTTGCPPITPTLLVAGALHVCPPSVDLLSRPVLLSPFARYIVVVPAIVTEPISPLELAVAVCANVLVNVAVVSALVVR